jgi:hypothetical protein
MSACTMVSNHMSNTARTKQPALFQGRIIGVKMQSTCHMMTVTVECTDLNGYLSFIASIASRSIILIPTTLNRPIPNMTRTSQRIPTPGHPFLSNSASLSARPPQWEEWLRIRDSMPASSRHVLGGETYDPRCRRERSMAAEVEEVRTNQHARC